MVFLMPHVCKPMEDQEMLSSGDVFREMLLVVCRKTGEIFSVREFARKVKNRQEHIGK